MTNKRVVDVLVSGAGATGWSLLLALSHQMKSHQSKTDFFSAKKTNSQHSSTSQKLSVALVDAFDNSKAQSHPGFDARALALSQQSLRYFKKLDLAQSIAEISTPIHKIHVSDKGGVGQVNLHHDDYQQEELGAVVEAQDLGKLLQFHGVRAFSAPGAAADSEQFSRSDHNLSLEHFQPNHIVEISDTRDSSIVTLDSGQEIQAKLLVLAEGSSSGSRELLQLPNLQEDYKQHAIITNVQTQKPHENIAWERFTASGPLAFLPMTAQRSGIVWSVDAKDVEGLLQLNDLDFSQQLQQAFGYRLGKFLKIGKRQSYPLLLSKVDDSLAHRVVCIGNAAQTLHPIAGQGFNLAFRDAWQLAQCIKKWTDERVFGEVDGLGEVADFGDFQRLSEYKKLRLHDREQTIWFTDGLVRLFSNNNPILQSARNIGLLTMQNNQGLKQQLARMAMGHKQNQTGE